MFIMYDIKRFHNYFKFYFFYSTAIILQYSVYKAVGQSYKKRSWVHLSDVKPSLLFCFWSQNIYLV